MYSKVSRQGVHIEVQRWLGLLGTRILREGGMEVAQELCLEGKQSWLGGVGRSGHGSRLAWPESSWKAVSLIWCRACAAIMRYPTETFHSEKGTGLSVRP